MRRDPREGRGDTTRINERIRVREVRVIGSDGEQLGVMPPEEALARAREEGLDLVEVAPHASPPVCRIMDYGRYKYEQKKKQQASRAKRKGSASLKEVKLRPRTDDHDLEVKLRNARRFLLDGDKVKLTLTFRGREMVHRNLGYAQLQRAAEMLAPLASVENPPRMEGRILTMILVPNREAIAEYRKEQEEKAHTAGDGEPADAAPEA